jgi:septal ring factor EnvC (AmiA/AmiB activator)
VASNRRHGKPLHSAGVLRGWLYRQKQIRDLSSQHRGLDPPPARVTAQRASADSLRQRLDAARAEISRLRAENHSLRDQIARQIGLRRTHHGSDPSAEPR